jgi:hypothetical protein
MDQKSTSAYYTAGIILESIDHPENLDAIQNWLVEERIEDRPTEEEAIWHVREYHLPMDRMNDVTQMLEIAIKPGWYIHIFNMTEKVLWVILHGKTFKLPVQKGESWEPMIAYGLSVGVERRWTDNIPVRRV